MARHGENIRKRTDGRWESRLLENGKYKCFYGHSYMEVKRKRSEYVKQHSETREEVITEPHRVIPYMTQIFSEWLTKRIGLVKKSSYVNYYNLINARLLPEFGNAAITDMTPERINRYITELMENESAPLSVKYIHDIVCVLRSVVIYMTENYEITIKVSDIISVPLVKQDIDILSEEEQRRLVTTLLNVNANTAVGIVLCLYTGMRIGELCALKWSDIHLSDGYISITKTVYRLKNTSGTGSKTVLVIDKPKTAASVRKIPINTYIEDILRKSSCGSPEHYFLTGTEKFIEPRTYQNIFKRYLKLSGVRNVNFHMLRHTFATNCICAGCDIKSLSEILGHSSVKITLDKYVHPSMNTKKAQLDKLPVFPV